MTPLVIQKLANIRILYACVTCRRLFEGGSWRFGVPAVCPECRKGARAGT